MENAAAVNHRPNLVLSGFMGTGKSTVGLIIARRLGMEFVDTDSRIEAEAGMSVSEIFRVHGESTFRKMEHELCLRLAGEQGRVIATGGGALLNAESKAALEGSGVLILLTCERDILFQRLQESARTGERPLLRDDLETTIATLLQKREQLYASIERKVDTTHLTPYEAADRVLEVYGSLVGK